jgi:hypothetical protein
MRGVYSFYCVAALGLLSAPAFSADKSFELTEVSGKVLVTTSNGALPATLGQKIPQGARIFVGDSALARVASVDGICNASLPANKVTVVSYKKLCDVKITPTASSRYSRGVPPVVVGLTFFAGASAVVGISMATNDDNGPISTP